MKINDRICKVNGYWIHSNNYKKERPFFEIPYINNQVKETEEQEAYTAHKTDKGAGP